MKKQALYEGLYNVYAEGVFCESTRAYTTTLPGQKQQGENTVSWLPRYGRQGKYFIRGSQSRHALRSVTVYNLTGEAYLWPSFLAAMQAHQGGFMTKMTLAEQQQLREANPVIDIFGTSSVPGSLHVAHHVVINGDPFVHPIVRTHGVNNGTYRFQDDQRWREIEAEIARRAPISQARANKKNENTEDRISTLRKRLRIRAPDLLDELDMIEEKKSEAQRAKALDDWLKKKQEEFDEKLKALGGSEMGTSLQQAQAGFQALPPGTTFTHGWELYHKHLSVIGLFVCSMYNPRPVLGGKAADGCGAHLRTIYRLSFSQGMNPPDFDVLLRIEPFKRIAIAVDDIEAGETWKETCEKVSWYSIDKLDSVPRNEDGSEKLIVQALRAWDSCLKEFDLNFVPGEFEGDPNDDENGSGEVGFG